MKFPSAVQDLFKIEREREAFTGGKPEATSCPSGKDMGFKCLLLVRKSKNIHLKYSIAQKSTVMTGSSGSMCSLEPIQKASVSL